MVQVGSTVQDIIDRAEADGFEIGVAILGPDGASFSHRGDDLFLSASTIKIAIMITLFRAIDRGDASLDDRYVLRADDKVPGSGVLQQLHAGIELTLRDVVYLMISISDNPATNILIDRLGKDAINATMRDLGMPRSILGRQMRGRPALEGEQENLATPNEFARMMRAILDGNAASAESCEVMIGLLELQQNTRRIGRFVPAGTGWGSKTGSYGTVVNDVGYVLLEGGPLVISVFTARVPDMVAGEILVSEIARAAMDSALDNSGAEY
jgi:beta-lactamase class A